MHKTIIIGTGASIPRGNIDYICSPGSSPIKTKLRLAAEQNRITDLTNGKKTRTLIFTKNGEIIRSSVLFDTLNKRFNESGGGS